MSELLAIGGLFVLIAVLVFALVKSGKRSAVAKRDAEEKDEILTAVARKKLRDNRVARDPKLADRVRKYSRGS